ncbi:MAG: helix-turn-helix domain-containing protein [Allosphingosinicella sp.]
MKGTGDMGAQIVEIGGQRIAMLPVADYQRLLDLAEDKADALAAIEAERRREQGEEYLPAEFADRLLAGESPLRLWRKHRGMTLDALATAVGIGKSFLSQIEKGTRRGSPSIWRKLARALDVSADDILPAAD